MKQKSEFNWLKKKPKDEVTIWIDCAIRNSPQLLAEMDRLEAAIRAAKEALADMAEIMGRGPMVNLYFEDYPSECDEEDQNQS